MAGSVNPTVQLSYIRSQIDRQQAAINILEQELQVAILGGDNYTVGEIVALVGNEYGIGGTDVNGNPTVDASGNPIYTVTNDFYTVLADSMLSGVNKDLGAAPTDVAEQDVIRQMLYQARALLGELRVEEQHWNGEVGEEKSRRKDLGDLTKG